MKIVTIRDARANLSRLIREACRGKDVVIARGAKLAVRLVPIEHVRGPRQPGTLKGKLHVGSEFFEPLPTDELF
jgi:prevent-host-death family protein